MSKWESECEEPQAGSFAGNGGSDQQREMQAEKPISVVKELVSFVATTGAFLVAFLIVIHFVARPVVVQGASMESTCHDGDYMIIWQLGYQPQKGDIVVTDEENPLGKRLVKRVIAVGGDHVRIADGELWLNGEWQEESYLKEQDWNDEAEVDLVVPEAEVFLMGDNRNDSADSRVIGTISEQDLMGKVIVRLFPFDKIGML